MAHLAIFGDGKPDDGLQELEAHEGVLIIHQRCRSLLVWLEVGHDEDGVTVAALDVGRVRIWNLHGETLFRQFAGHCGVRVKSADEPALNCTVSGYLLHICSRKNPWSFRTL